MMIGLGENYWRVRTSLTPGLSDLLDGRKAWFDSLKDFRDALAHRIPLYIPPFMVDPDDDDAYAASDQAASQALHAGDLPAYAQHTASRDALRHFKPVMAQDLQANPNLIVFHPQLIVDLNTINELASAFLDELQ
jgi:hypothetical protein